MGVYCSMQFSQFKNQISTCSAAKPTTAYEPGGRLTCLNNYIYPSCAEEAIPSGFSNVAYCDMSWASFESILTRCMGYTVETTRSNCLSTEFLYYCRDYSVPSSSSADVGFPSFSSADVGFLSSSDAAPDFGAMVASFDALTHVMLSACLLFSFLFGFSAGRK